MYSPPGLITLSRLPMAIAFPFVAVEPTHALALYIAALITDVADGTVARKMGRCSHTGSVLDGWLDKVLHVNAAWSLVVFDYMPGWWMLCWFARELIQGPMVFWLVGPFARGRVRPHHASPSGKIAAVLLAACMIATILGWRTLAGLLTPAVGLTGAWAGFGYLRRELRQLRNLGDPPHQKAAEAADANAG